MTFEAGEKVKVVIQGREFTGTINRVRPGYNWTNRTWYEVSGSKPEPFVTLTPAVWRDQ